MNCKTLLMSMSSYIDGELEQELCQALKKHLKGCDRCRVVFDTTRQTIKFYQGSRPIKLPRDVHSHLRRILQSRWMTKRKTPKRR